MKAFRINPAGTVDALDGPVADWRTKKITWDAIELDDAHDLYVDDEALFASGLIVTATVGGRPNVPLPAYVLGRDGERDADATLTIEQVRAVISDTTLDA